MFYYFQKYTFKPLLVIEREVSLCVKQIKASFEKNVYTMKLELKEGTNSKEIVL